MGQISKPIFYQGSTEIPIGYQPRPVPSTSKSTPAISSAPSPFIPACLVGRSTRGTAHSRPGRHHRTGPDRAINGGLLPRPGDAAAEMVVVNAFVCTVKTSNHDASLDKAAALDGMVVLPKSRFPPSAGWPTPRHKGVSPR